MQMKGITLAIPALAMAAFAQSQDPSQKTEAQSGTTMQEEQRPVRHARTGQETAKTRTYKGTLVDASCARNMAGADTSTRTTSAERSAAESTETGEHKSQTGTATGSQAASGSHGAMHRDAKAVSKSCPITSSTTDFALVTSDGRFLQLNDEGDAKVASEMKTNNKWNKAINSNKRITASVRGSLEGDTLQVESVK